VSSAARCMTPRRGGSVAGGAGAREPYRLDRHALLGLLVHPESVTRTARQRGEQFHPAPHLAADGHILIELSRRLPDDHVQLVAGAALGGGVAADTHGAVTMRE